MFNNVSRPSTIVMLCVGVAFFLLYRFGVLSYIYFVRELPIEFDDFLIYRLGAIAAQTDMKSADMLFVTLAQALKQEFNLSASPSSYYGYLWASSASSKQFYSLLLNSMAKLFGGDHAIATWLISYTMQLVSAFGFLVFLRNFVGLDR